VQRALIPCLVACVMLTAASLGALIGVAVTARAGPPRREAEPRPIVVMPRPFRVTCPNCRFDLTVHHPLPPSIDFGKAAKTGTGDVPK
jgi:hypothetical protein